jgi:hypothetical protein
MTHVLISNMGYLTTHRNSVLYETETTDCEKCGKRQFLSNWWKLSTNDVLHESIATGLEDRVG